MSPEPPAPVRWKCACAYDGGPFSGWQSQPGGRAVQDVIEARLAQVLGSPVRIHGSGRTDAGVHAVEQVFHFDAAWRHGPERLRAALSSILDPRIQIKSVRRAPADFHARHSALGKVYEYRVHRGEPDPFTRPYCWPVLRPLDLEAMESTAALLLGRHDFRAFSAFGGEQVPDTVRDLRRLSIHSRGRLLRVVAEADGFLYKMVRSLVGALVSVGEHRLDPARVRAILESCERTAAVPTAPPQGLFLRKVIYGGNRRRNSGLPQPARRALD